MTQNPQPSARAFLRLRPGIFAPHGGCISTLSLSPVAAPSRIEPLNRAIGAPVSDPARFKMRDIEPGRRPALQFKGSCAPRGWVLPAGGWLVLFLIFEASLFAQSSSNALPPLAPAYGEMAPTFWEQHGTTVLILIFAFLAVVGAILWSLLRPKPPVVVPPEVLARESLTRLARQPETGDVLSEISQTLRRYAAIVFGFAGDQQTTSEFSAALLGSETVGPELARTISTFLQTCDERKFSPANPGTPLHAAERALEIILEIEQQRAKFAGQHSCDERRI
jgi:hypothetical protein